MVSRNSLAVIGCGQMAAAIIKGIHSSGLSYEALMLYDTNPRAACELADSCNGRVTDTMAEAVAAVDMVLLAVKPQVIPTLIPELSRCLSNGQLIISIVTGISTHYLQQELGSHAAVVRVMPNTPCLVGKGTLAICKGKYAQQDDLTAVDRMFSAVGQIIMATEEQMDSISALSGCGPAYFLLMAEAMIDAGVELGLPRNLAADLVKNTLAGTGAMWEKSGAHPVSLKEQVTSPGGSTIAALRVLEERGLRAAMINAVVRASERTKEIGRSVGKGV